MVTITTKIPDTLAAQIEAVVQRDHATRSEVVRRALQDYVERSEPFTAKEAMEGFLGVCEGPADLSSNKKHLKGYGT